MKRLLILRLTPDPGPLETALGGAETFEMRPLPNADDPPEAWDALVAAMLNAEIVVTDGW